MKLFLLLNVLFHQLASLALATPMWATCSTSVTTAFNIPTTGGDFEAVGCRFPTTFVKVNDFATRTNPTSILVSGGTVGGSMSSSGLSFAWVTFNDAPLMTPIHLTVRDVTFGKEAILVFTGALPPSSSVTITNNSFFNTIKNSNIAAIDVVVAVIIGVSGASLALQAASQFAISNNSFTGSSTGLIYYHGVYLYFSVLSLSDASTFHVDGNLFSDLNVGQRNYGIQWLPSAITVEGKSTVSMSSNTLWNIVGKGSMHYGVSWASPKIDIIVDDSVVLLCSNSFTNLTSSSSWADGNIQAVLISGIGSLLVTNNATFAMNDNGVYNSSLTSGGNIYTVFFSSLPAQILALSITNGSHLTADNNRVVNSQCLSNNIWVVHLNAGLSSGSADLVATVSQNSSLSIQNNLVENSICKSSLGAVYVYRVRNINVTSGSELSVSRNIVASSTIFFKTNGKIASTVTLTGVSGTLYYAEHDSIIAIDDNKFLEGNVTCDLHSVYMNVIDAPFSSFAVSLNDGVMSVSRNEISNSITTNSVQTIFFEVSYSAASTSYLGILVGNHSSFVVNENKATNITLGDGYAQAVVWSVGYKNYAQLATFINATCSDASTMSVQNNSLSMINGTKLTYAYTVWWNVYANINVALNGGSSLAMDGNSLRNTDPQSVCSAVAFTSKSITYTLGSEARLSASNNTLTNAIVGMTAASVLLSSITSLSVSLSDKSSLVMSRNSAENVAANAVGAVMWQSVTGTLRMHNKSALMLGVNAVAASFGRWNISAVSLNTTGGLFAVNVEDSNMTIFGSSIADSAASQAYGVMLTASGVALRAQFLVCDTVLRNVTTSRRAAAVYWYIPWWLTLDGSHTLITIEGNYLASNKIGSAASVVLLSLGRMVLRDVSALTIHSNSLQLMEGGELSELSVLSIIGSASSSLFIGITLTKGSVIQVTTNQLLLMNGSTLSATLLNVTVPLSASDESTIKVVLNNVSAKGIRGRLINFLATVSLNTGGFLMIDQNNFTIQQISAGCPAVFVLQSVQATGANTSVYLAGNKVALETFGASNNLPCSWLVVGNLTSIASVSIEHNVIHSRYPVIINATNISVPVGGRMNVSANAFSVSTEGAAPIAGNILRVSRLLLDAGSMLAVEKNGVFAPFQDYRQFGIVSADHSTVDSFSSIAACGNVFFGIDVIRPKFLVTPPQLARSLLPCTNVSVTSAMTMSLTTNATATIPYAIPYATAITRATETLSKSAHHSGSKEYNRSATLTLSVSKRRTESLSKAVLRSISAILSMSSELSTGSIPAKTTKSLNTKNSSSQPVHTRTFQQATFSLTMKTFSMPFDKSATGKSSSGSVAPPSTITNKHVVTATPLLTRFSNIVLHTVTENIPISDSSFILTLTSAAHTPSAAFSKSVTFIVPTMTLKEITTVTVADDPTTGDTEITTVATLETNPTATITNLTNDTNVTLTPTNTILLSNITDTNTSSPTTTGNATSGEATTSSSFDTFTSDLPSVVVSNETATAATDSESTTHVTNTSVLLPTEATTSAPTNTSVDTEPVAPSISPSAPPPTSFTLPVCPIPLLTYPTTEQFTPIANVINNGLTLRIALAANSSLHWSIPTNRSAITLSGSLASSIAQISCVIESPILLLCTLPSQPLYAMPDQLAQEVITVSVSPAAFADACIGVQEAGAFVIIQKEPVKLAAVVASVITFAVASGPVLLALVGDPTNVEMQMLVAMFSSEACATVDEREAAHVARYIALSPFSGLGAESVVVGHILIIVAITAIQVLLAGTIGIITKTYTFTSALHRLRFPHVPFVVTGVLLAGLCFGSLELLTAPDNSDSVSLAIGAAGLSISVLFLFIAFLLIIFRLRLNTEFLVYALSSTNSDVKLGWCSKALACYDLPAVRRWMWPRGTYAPAVVRKAYYSALFSVVPARAALIPYPAVVCLITSILLHVGRGSVGGGESAFRCSHR